MSIPFDEARTTILDSVSPLGIERVPLLDAAGRVLAEEIVAPWDLPLCDTSAMDGYAVRAADYSPGTPLTVTGFVAAGQHPETALTHGTAVKIMTGAPLPPGCDAVVPVEETRQEGERVWIEEAVTARQHIRFRGGDVAAGNVVVPAATVLRAPEISMLASLGRAIIPVYRRARVAILSTGDELLELGHAPEPGKIVNSNSYSLAVAVRECGAEPVLLGIARDERESHREKLAAGLICDALITSAGVSAGDRDLVREVLAELGVRQLFWKIAMKPGGPTAYGLREQTPVFSLPGNPVSTMVTFEELVRPALLRMMGHRRVIRPFVKATLREDVRKPSGKTTFLRVHVEVEQGRYHAITSGNQHTANLRTMVNANGLAVLPPEVTFVPAGSEVDLQLLREEAAMLDK